MNRKRTKKFLTYWSGDSNPRFSVIFSPMIWIFMEGEGVEIKSKQASKRDRTLLLSWWKNNITSLFLVKGYLWCSHSRRLFSGLRRVFTCVLGSSSIWTCRISNICYCFPQAGKLEKINTNTSSMFKIRHVQIDELPRTLVPGKYFLRLSSLNVHKLMLICTRIDLPHNW